MNTLEVVASSKMIRRHELQFHIVGFFALLYEVGLFRTADALNTTLIYMNSE